MGQCGFSHERQSNAANRGRTAFVVRVVRGARRRRYNWLEGVRSQSIGCAHSKDFPSNRQEKFARRARDDRSAAIWRSGGQKRRVSQYGPETSAWVHLGLLE